MMTTIKKILLVITLCVIAYFTIVFILATAAILVTMAIVGLSIFGAYIIWQKYAMKELMKKEENFEILKEK